MPLIIVTLIRSYAHFVPRRMTSITIFMGARMGLSRLLRKFYAPEGQPVLIIVYTLMAQLNTPDTMTIISRTCLAGAFAR
jgi:hypothetical protein